MASDSENMGVRSDEELVSRDYKSLNRAKKKIRKIFRILLKNPGSCRLERCTCSESLRFSYCNSFRMRSRRLPAKKPRRTTTLTMAVPAGRRGERSERPKTQSAAARKRRRSATTAISLIRNSNLKRSPSRKLLATRRLERVVEDVVRSNLRQSQSLRSLPMELQRNLKNLPSVRCAKISA